VIVSYSPPLPLGLSAWLLSRIWRVPWVLQIEDLYPEAAIAAGVTKSKPIINFFLWMEEFLYQSSQHISLISESFRQTLLNKQVPNAKMDVIPVWADPDEVRPLPTENTFRHKHGLDHKFVVMYAGNIGLTSCIEDVLQAAEILRGRTDIQFLIVGEGVKKEALEAEVRSKQLTNITILPYQPREVFPEMLAAADISLVTLNPGAALSSLPSKVFNVMASARPILAVAPPESELAQIVKRADCGWVVPPGLARELATNIVQLIDQNSARTQMGQNGRVHLERYYSRSRCVDVYEKMLIDLCGYGEREQTQVLPGKTGF
jgi:colanic acid biosynthesis glycosyl transferase WcaI